jgi:GGDEF domain-containing protein
MENGHPTSPYFTAMSSIIAFAAGVGVWFVLAETTALESFVIIPITTLLITAMLMLMLRESMQVGHQTGATAAETDVFTRLPSHAVAYQFLLREFAAAERSGRALTVVLFTLDNMPRLAAAKGAAEANKILLAVGAVMKRHTRGMNMSARLDGSYTMLSVLGSVDERGAAVFVEKICRDLNSIRVGGRRLEVRVGLASYDSLAQSASELLARAHDSLTAVNVPTELKIA